jgi:hypothetical protein
MLTERMADGGFCERAKGSKAILTPFDESTVSLTFLA